MNRNEMLDMMVTSLAQLPKVAEVGVLRGTFSKEIIARMNPSYFLMVDPWREFVAGFNDYKDLRQTSWDIMYNSVVSRFGGLGRDIRRGLSLEVAATVPDGSLDMVYIDANHAYEFVRDDLTAWLPKVRDGGYISGHDYNLKSVKRAVAEVLGQVNCTHESTIQSYYLRK